MRIFNLVTCTDINGGIARLGKLPWSFPRDMNNFKTITTRPNRINVVIMGRKTFQSLGRPLPDRINMVISSRTDISKSFKNVVVFSSIEECVNACLIQKNKKYTNDDFFIIGGASIYNYFLLENHCLLSKIYLTTILKKYDCDTFINKDFIFPVSVVHKEKWNYNEKLKENKKIKINSNYEILKVEEN